MKAGLSQRFVAGEPVSYTHLDVYKRQVKGHLPAFGAGPCAKDQRPAVFVIHRFKAHCPPALSILSQGEPRSRPDGSALGPSNHSLSLIHILAGMPANNVLLYGDAGTGKSSAVKAIANEFAPDGLRLDVYKRQPYFLLWTKME